jgi:hypothetical protein
VDRARYPPARLKPKDGAPEAISITGDPARISPVQVEGQIQFGPRADYVSGGMPFTIDGQSSPLLGQATEFVRLSKSRFVAGVQCLRRLYLQTYADSPIAVDPRLQEQLDQGQRLPKLRFQEV